MRYLVIIEKSETGYGAHSPDLAGCVATGATLDEVETTMREAVEFHIETLKQDGIRVPTVRRRSPPSDQAGKWLLKPLRSAGGQRVQLWRPNMPSAGDGNGDYFFQQFVPGTVCSASFLATRGD